MALLDPVVVEGAKLLARQATSSMPSSIVSSVMSMPTGSTPTDSSSVSGSLPTDASQTSGVSNQNTSSPQSSSPLLFFVALGFGVVFTNLWIIVGVKYCFRYNARSRQLRTAEDGEPITMENMPRPHRRRREKKLMSMDEVNEKFPMIKYKAWVHGRANQGLPSRGGVSAPASRANSLHDVEGIVPELRSKEEEEGRPKTEESTRGDAISELPESTSTPELGPTKASMKEAGVVAADGEIKDMTRTSQDGEDEDDDQINPALPPECVGTSGDTCAICIDTLEDDDDVRGLTCGHAFHAVCLDPWLTSRRACCPLCKADYYTPKQRPAVPVDLGDGTTGDVAVTLSDNDPRNNRMNLPSRPRQTLFGFRNQARRTTTPRVQSAAAAYESSVVMARLRELRIMSDGDSDLRVARPPAPRRTPSAPGSGMWANLRSGLGRFRPRPSRSTNEIQGQNNQPTASGVIPDATPSNLEAGVRQSTTAR